MNILISINAPQWRTKIPDIEDLTNEVLSAAAMSIPTPIAQPCEVSICFADDVEMTAFNQRYRQQAKPTNVLAFANYFHDGPDSIDPGIVASMDDDNAGSPPLMLGDIILAFGVASREAQAQQKPVTAHVSHLLIHGYLHLLGYDHETEAEATQMEALEVAVLARLNIANPYGLQPAHPGSSPISQSSQKTKGA